MRKRECKLLGGLFLVLALVAVGLFSWRGETQIWTAVAVEMPGLSAPVETVLEGGFRLELKSGGGCLLKIGGEQLRARWRQKQGEIRIRGGGVRTEGSVEEDVMVLEDVMGWRFILIRENSKD